MDEQQARDEIRLIKEMVEKTRKATAQSGTLFIFWGFLVIAAVVVTYVLAYFHKFHWIWANWIAWAVIGWGYSALYGIRQERTRKTRTYAQMAVQHLSIACGTAYLLAAFVFPPLKVYSYNAISILVAFISGILVFVMGGIYEWSLLKWCGLLWWLGAVGMIFVPGDYRTLCFIPLIIFGYLVPGFILRSKYKREQSSK
jgi:hypothetical protein